MFVNFNKVFNKKPQSELNVPEALARHLSNSLPDGIKYVISDDGNGIVITSDDKISIQGFTLAPTEEQKKILGENYTNDDVLELCQNSQESVPVKLLKEGYVILNGKEFPADKLSYKPFKPISYKIGSAVLVPPPMPEPFTLNIGGDVYSCDLLFKRIPNKSVNVYVFESEPERALYVKYYLNMNTKEMKFHISFNLTYANSINDIVIATSIYNAIIDGKGTLCNMPLYANTDNVGKKYDVNSICFWEKMMEIEKKMKIEFSPPYDNVNFETMCIVEEIYQNIINKKPIKQNEKINRLDGDWNSETEDDMKNSIGKSLFLEFEATTEINLFGQTLSFYSIIGVINAKLAKYEKNGDKHTIFLEDESDEETMYTSILRFLEREELLEFRKSEQMNKIDIFSTAKMAHEYF